MTVGLAHRAVERLALRLLMALVEQALPVLRVRDITVAVTTRHAVSNDLQVVVAALLQSVALHLAPMISRVPVVQDVLFLLLVRVLFMAVAAVVAALVPQVHLQQLVQVVLAVAVLVAEFAE
jgi:uncharacterized membrane protein YheB (UPF0754 family)